MSTTSGKLVPIAVKKFANWEELYMVVDFLNKTLKHKQVIFGLSKSKDDDTMALSIYET